MSHRRTATALALLALVLTTAGCADDGGTAGQDATDDGTSSATSRATSTAADPSKAVVAHAKAYAALVDHPVFVEVQTTDPESLPAFVDDVTGGKLTATSNGNMWTFTDVGGECATKLSTDENGGVIHGTTCGGVEVDKEFAVALEEARAS